MGKEDELKNLKILISRISELSQAISTFRKFGNSVPQDILEQLLINMSTGVNYVLQIYAADLDKQVTELVELRESERLKISKDVEKPNGVTG